MYLLSSPLSFLEIAIFLLAVLAFVLAIRFFMDSQKRLEDLLPGSAVKKRKTLWLDRSGFIVPKQLKRNSKPASTTLYKPYAADADTKEELKALRTMVLQQQQDLARAIQQMTSSSQPAQQRVEEESGSAGLSNQKKLEQLKLQVEKKDAEIKRLRQKEALSDKLQQRYEEVEEEFEKMQEKMQKMEQQAWQAADLTIKLDHVEQAHLQVEKALLKKEEKLRELSVENQRLHDILNETEDKLSEANLQRQQMTKKVQFLEEINTDMKQMAEANRKLKNELNRVGELESMLHLITEERDALLQKRK